MTLTAEQIAEAEAAGLTRGELDQIELLRERASIFERAMQHLRSIEPSVIGTELEDEWRALLDRGQTLRARIESATQAIANALGWARRSLGLDGMRNNLGVVWFIPMAVVAAAVAAIGWWIADYQKFARKFEEQQRIAQQLRDEGVDPIEAERQAAAAVAGTVPGWLQPLQQPLGLVALAAGGYLVYRMMQGDEG